MRALCCKFEKNISYSSSQGSLFSSPRLSLKNFWSMEEDNVPCTPPIGNSRASTPTHTTPDRVTIKAFKPVNSLDILASVAHAQENNVCCKINVVDDEPSAIDHVVQKNYIRAWYPPERCNILVNLKGSKRTTHKRGIIRETISLRSGFFIKLYVYTCKRRPNSPACQSCIHKQWNSKCTKSRQLWILSKK